MARKKRITQASIHAMQIRRLCFFAGCVLTGFGCLAFRLVDLQVVRHEQLSEEARNNTERTIVREPRRGEIRDIRGNLLATSKIVHDICADPHVIGTNYFAVAQQIAPLLDMPVSKVAEELEPRKWTNSAGVEVPVQWVRLKRKVEREDWLKIQEAMLRLSFGVDESTLSDTQRAHYNRIRQRAVFNEPDEIRFYPNETLAAHMLGFVGVHDHTNSAGRRVIQMRGKAGIEFALNSVLTGTHGWVQTETDSRRRELVQFREQDVAPRPGLNAILTVDAGLQHIVEDELAQAVAKHTPVSASCIVVRPRTGEILALATLPTFDPNRPGDTEPDHRRNRVITDLAEPGSTFKIVVVAAGLNEGLVNLDQQIDCENGVFMYAGIPLRDDHAFQSLSVRQVISKSSNIGSAKIGLELGKERLYEYVRAFGFGQTTGIPLPGEVRGITNPIKNWSKISITRIPMGHEIACTPLQMVMAMSAIANGGVLMRPMLVHSFVDEEGKAAAEFAPQPVRRVVSEEAAAQMVEALKAVVSTNGTGIKAGLPFYTVAGKTGTAQKIVDGRYVRNKHYSSFIGFFPADNPELCISVVLDDPKKGYYASTTAAPLFQKIAERAANYLALPPEHLPGNEIAALGTQPAKKR